MKILLILVLSWIIATEHSSGQIIRLRTTSKRIPLFSVNFNVKTIDIPVIAEHITKQETVTCSPISPLSASSTTGDFGVVQLTPTMKSGYLPFNCVKFGKKMHIHCHIIGLYNTSGNMGYLECKKPPVVFIEPELVLLWMRSTPFTYRMQVLLSEPTVDDAVKIVCTRDKNSAIIFSTDVLYVPPMTTSAALMVKITALNPGNQAKLSCSAQSVNGTQYQMKNSIGNTAILKVTKEELQLYPWRAMLNRLNFKLSLVSNGITQDLSLVCGVTQAKSEVNAEFLQQNPPCFAPTNSSRLVTDWKINPPNVDFKASEDPLLVQTLEVSRNAYPTASKTLSIEILVVSCCTVDASLSSGAKVTARIDVLLPNMPIKIAEDAISSGAQVVLPNPAFTEIAPCPCDITLDECDLGCCCDQLCPTRQPIPCFVGSFGGDFSNLHQDSCDYSRYKVLSNSPEIVGEFVSLRGSNSEVPREYSYHGLRCVSRNNGPVLGYFYPQQSVATDDSQLNENYATRGRFAAAPGLPDHGLRHYAAEDIGASAEYAKGASLSVERRATMLPGSTLRSVLEHATLVLPEPSNCDLPSGGPVHFLQNQERYQCPVQINRSTCESSQTVDSLQLPGKGPHSIASRLSSKVYLLGDGVVNHRIPNAYQVKANPLSGAPHVPSTVNYFCLNAQEATSYSIKSFRAVSSPFNSTKFFDRNCTYDQHTFLTTCNFMKKVPKVYGTTVSPCPWDNGYEVATPNLHTDVCRNVVLDVKYRFSWADGQVIGAEADIFLADLNVSTNETFYQAFSVHFVNLSRSNLKADQTSQLVGHKLGAEMIAGKRRKTTPGEFMVEVQDAASSGPFDSDLNNLCAQTGRAPFTFGQDFVGICLVPLDLTAFSDCVKLRSLMVAQLNRFIPSELVAVFDKPSATDADDWVEVQGQPVLINVSSNPDTIDVGMCDQVPSGIELDIFYSVQGRVHGEPVRLVLGAQLNYRNSTWALACDSSGLYSGCRGSSGQPYSDSETQQIFTLHTQITYTKVPSDWTEHIWRMIYAPHLPLRDALHGDFCTHDTCWREAFYAWNNYDKFFGLNNETTTYALVASLAVGAVGLTLVLWIGPFH